MSDKGRGCERLSLAVLTVLKLTTPATCSYEVIIADAEEALEKLGDEWQLE